MSPESGSFADHEWAIEYHRKVDSTQAVARGLPPWSAVAAAEQTVGRGQARRTFASNPGGLYLTAVVPYAGDALAARGFALAVGWGVVERLRQRGMEELRLRWPNDLMVGSRKVGGILVEQDQPDTLLVGVGLNLTNRPWELDSTLADSAARLADLFPPHMLPPQPEAIDLILEGIGHAQESFARHRLAGLAPWLNACWGGAREVVIEPSAGSTLTTGRGVFCGIRPDGALLLETGPGVRHAIPAHHVGRLQELV